MSTLGLRNPRLMTARGAATRGRIIEAAVALVAERGIRGTSLDDVMAATGVSKSQLYHYFADRSALMEAVVNAQVSRVIGFHAAQLEQIDSLAGLRRWRDAIVALGQRKGWRGGCPVGSLASELAEQSEPERLQMTQSFETWESHLARALGAMRDRGELAPAANPADLATAILGALQGGLLLAQTTRATRPLELALDMALAHVMRHSATPELAVGSRNS